MDFIIQIWTTKQWQGVLIMRFSTPWIIVKIFIRFFSPLVLFFFIFFLSDMALTTKNSFGLPILILLLSSVLGLALEVLLELLLITTVPLFSYTFAWVYTNCSYACVIFGESAINISGKLQVFPNFSKIYLYFHCFCKLV